MKAQTIFSVALLAAFISACSHAERITTEKGQFDHYGLFGENVVTLPGQPSHFLISGSGSGVLAGATDATGELVLAATVDSNGKPKFTTFDSNHKASATMGIDEKGEPILWLTGSETDRKIVGGINSSGLPVLTLKVGEPSAGAQARVSFTSDGGKISPYMLLESETRKFSIASSFGKSGEPMTAMTDSKGRPRLRFGIGVNDEPYIELLDESGKVTWNAK